MPTAQSAQDYVHEGLWINRSKGDVLGFTLTVSPSHAAILSPALAVFLSIAGSQLWRLFQFTLHQVRATPQRRSLIYHQQQIVLRNSASDLNTLWHLMRVAIAWRHQRQARVLRTSLPLILWTIMHLILVISIGLFSSWMLGASDEVLTRSPWCGTWNETYLNAVYSTDISDTTAIKLSMGYGNYLNSRYSAVQRNVDICANSQSGCESLSSESMTWTSNIVPGGCPFNTTVCHPDVEGSILFDTGLLSSAADLGFNMKKHDHVAFRMVAECAPLNDKDYSTGWQEIPATDDVPQHRTADVLLGPSITNARNATYSLTESNLECDQRAVTPAYSLNSQFLLPGGNVTMGTATFDAVSELQLSKSDTSLMLLSFLNSYTDAISDPWFSAQEVVNDTNAFCLGDDMTLYTRGRPLTTLGCTQQWQICNTDSHRLSKKDGCTPLLGLQQIQPFLSEAIGVQANFSSQQRAIIDRIVAAATGSSFYYVINTLSQSSNAPLKARNSMSNTISLPLPNNQWQIETTYWVQILLAILQQTSLDFSTGQFVASTDYVNVTRPSSSDPAMQAAYELCQSQIVHSNAYRNYNMFAMLLTIILGTIIIILGLGIEDLIGYVRQRNLRYSGPHGKQDMWVANSGLEMLKTIDEAKNGSAWTRSKNGIPLGPPGYEVSVQDLRNETVEVEKGCGVVNLAVKRKQSEMNEMRKSRRHPYTHGGNNKCAGCSTVKIPSTDASGGMSISDSSGASPAFTLIPGERLTHKDTDTREQTSTSHNTFNSQFKADIPVSNGETGSSASSKTPTQHHYRTANCARPKYEANELARGANCFAHPYTHEIPAEGSPQTRASSRPLTEREAFTPYTFSNDVTNNRSMWDLQHVYLSDVPDVYGERPARPPCGWGVLPARVSGCGRGERRGHM